MKPWYLVCAFLPAQLYGATGSFQCKSLIADQVTAFMTLARAVSDECLRLNEILKEDGQPHCSSLCLEYLTKKVPGASGSIKISIGNKESGGSFGGFPGGGGSGGFPGGGGSSGGGPVITPIPSDPETEVPPIVIGQNSSDGSEIFDEEDADKPKYQIEISLTFPVGETTELKCVNPLYYPLVKNFGEQLFSSEWVQDTYQAACAYAEKL